MSLVPDLSSRFAHPGYFAEVTLALLYIRDTKATGRLSIRNGERFSLAHLYFKKARLVHIRGDKGIGEVVLNDLLSWSKGVIRFDVAITVDFEDVTWQQVQVFTRWLAFLEMRGIMHGIPASDLAQRLTIDLPSQLLALPQKVEHYEEYTEAAHAHQWQHLSEGMNHFIERAISSEQREKLQQFSHSAVQHVKGLISQAGSITQKLTKQSVKMPQDRAH